jgi:hypothetical protein
MLKKDKISCSDYIANLTIVRNKGVTPCKALCMLVVKLCTLGNIRFILHDAEK